jgi:hypothetical protein
MHEPYRLRRSDPSHQLIEHAVPDDFRRNLNGITDRIA